MDNYILDFYAPSIKLAIELDGGQHYEDKGLAYDAHRTEVLSRLGVTVLRFSNLDIDKHLKRSVDQIVAQIELLLGKSLY